AEDGIRGRNVTGVQTCALPICMEVSDRLPHEQRIEQSDMIGDADRALLFFAERAQMLLAIDAAAVCDLQEHGAADAQDAADDRQIGRASCRERAWGRRSARGSR